MESHLDDRQLIDSFPQGQQNEKFTWRRGNCCSRLDYIFVSTGLSSRITQVNTEWYTFGSNYDHASVTVEIRNKVGIPRGRGFPKLFKSDISSPRSIAWLAAQLEAAKAQIPLHWNPHQIHEFLKMSLRSKSLELRAMNKRHYSSKALTDKINALLQFPTDASMQEADQLKFELLQAEEAEAEELRLRAGIKWREQGEKSSKYFLGRLKTRELARELHSLVDSNGDTVSSLKGVLEHVKSFYAKLYEAVFTPNLNDHAFFEHCPALDPLQQQQLSSPLTLAELRDTLKSCHDSAPGLDGIPYSFYATFGDLLLPTLLDSWNYAISTGQLAPSHLQSCISLLPKKDKDLKLIQNWRPISLSSCDLKIITKTYARRLSLILPEILAESQAAYVPGRDISFNNRLLRTAQSFAINQNKDYCVVSLDARKAFDSVSHSYLVQVMEAYQFPREFIKIFSTLYANNSALVQVNGHLSDPFQLNRGVKQGDALSCGLFVLAIDPLLRNIAANDRIKGLIIPIDGQESIEIKVLAYADDVAVFCKNRNLQPIFTEYERLSTIVLNADKTEVLNLIASDNNLSRIKYQDLDFTLGRIDSIRICGINLSNLPEVDYQRNVLDVIGKMEKIVSSWRKRTLTLNGRMLAAKTFVLSQIVFQAQVITIATKEIKKIERLIYSFVNGAKSLYGPERIARRRLKATKEQEGINGVDVDSFIKAIQVRQFNKDMNKHRILSSLQRSYKGCDDDLSCSVMSFLRSHYRNNLKTGILDLQQITQVSGIPLKFLLVPGTRGQSYAMNSAIFSLYRLQNAINNDRIPRTQSNIILKQLPIVIRNLIRSQLVVDSQLLTLVSTEEKVFNSADSCSSAMLRRRFLDLKSPIPTVKAKEVYKEPLWQEPENWQSRIWKIGNPQLRAYRLKVLYKDVFSNERRHRFGISDSPNCVICGQIESIEHQLLECTNARKLWEIYFRITGNSITNLLQIIICTESIEIEIVKSIIIKRLIQLDRSRNINIAGIKQEIKHYFRLESCLSINSEPMFRFWNQCMQLVDQA